jgi:hypothetical protein
LFSALFSRLVRGEIERYNDREESELWAWVRGVKRLESARRSAETGEPDRLALEETTRLNREEVERLRLELAHLYERAERRPRFPLSRRRRRRDPLALPGPNPEEDSAKPP